MGRSNVVYLEAFRKRRSLKGFLAILQMTGQSPSLEATIMRALDEGEESNFVALSPRDIRQMKMHVKKAVPNLGFY